MEITPDVREKWKIVKEGKYLLERLIMKYVSRAPF
jgi:hypothetical protein